MADKKSAHNTKPPSSSTTDTVALTELESLRHLVFGATKSNIEQRISALEQHTEERFIKMQLTSEKTL